MFFSSIKNAYRHFVTITTHKMIVMQSCFKVGMFKQGLLHDLSKYTPVEFLTGVKYYQGTRSPNSAEREAKGYSESWLHHKGRNKHHYEYYVDFLPRDKENLIQFAPMQDKYVVEMFFDRVAACKVYNGSKFRTRDAYDYYMRGDTARFLHPRTKQLLERLLKMYAKYGEKYTNSYIRNRIFKGKLIV